MRSIGLVLGGGGVVGTAYHIGTLAALTERTGWDAADADLIVGTSAGASVGATLRAGISAHDHYERSQGRPIAQERYVPREELTFAAPPPPGLLDRLPMAPWLVIPAFVRLGLPRLGLLAGLLPPGRGDGSPLADRVRAVLPGRWPAAPLWVCATRVRDGARVVLGRDDVDVPDAGVAVQASSAVAGRVRPVTIAGTTYFDGGFYSPTNADLVAGLGFDLVVVVSPLTAVPGALGWGPDGLQRRFNARRLAGEVLAVRKGGTRVLVLEPTPADLDAMGPDPTDATRARAVAAQAYRSAAAHLDRPAASARLAILDAAAAERSATPGR